MSAPSRLPRARQSGGEMTAHEYLGDSVYVAIDNRGCLILTTENGFGPSNKIVLEPEVFGALMEYACASEFANITATKAEDA